MCLGGLCRVTTLQLVCAKKWFKLMSKMDRVSTAVLKSSNVVVSPKLFVSSTVRSLGRGREVLRRTHLEAQGASTTIVYRAQQVGASDLLKSGVAKPQPHKRQTHHGCLRAPSRGLSRPHHRRPCRTAPRTRRREAWQAATQTTATRRTRSRSFREGSWATANAPPKRHNLPARLARADTQPRAPPAPRRPTRRRGTAACPHIQRVRNSLRCRCRCRR